MSIHRPIPPELARQLDLLADGELDEARRRQLLQSLEQTPELWRPCALAFLAAQSWRRELRGFVSEAPLANVPVESADSRHGDRPALRIADRSTFPAQAASASSASGLAGRWSAPMAVAASFLAAFTLGILMRGMWGQNGFPVESSVVGQGAKSYGAGDAQAPPPSPNQLAVERPPLPERPLSDRENLTLVVDDGDGRSRRVNVPLVDDTQLGTPVNWNAEPVVPVDIQRQLEQAGHRVQRQRRYAPFQLDDGRQVVVPVEDVQIVPVGRKMY